MDEVRTEALSDRFCVSILSRTRLTGQVFELRMERPGGFQFNAGQWIRLFRNGEHRDYTLINGPDDPFLAVCIQYTKPGFSASLADIPLQGVVEIGGAQGYFTFRSSRRLAVCIATGTGVTPFVAYARHGRRAHLLLQGAARASDLHYRGELERFAETYVPCLTSESDPGAAAVGFPGRVTAYLSDRLDSGAYDFHLCGSGGMIRDAMHIIDDRFPESRVFSEHFD